MKYAVAGLFLSVLIANSADQKTAANGKGMGFPTAPVTIEVFSDFECPHCKLLYEETLRPLMHDYVASGKVFLVHRDFPLPNHPHAREAAGYANASAQLSKYEEVCAALFSRQMNWSANGNVGAAVASVLSPAEMYKVRPLVTDPKIMAAIEQDVALGRKYNITQTPTMEITCNGRTTPVAGAVSYAILSRYLNDLLSK